MTRFLIADNPMVEESTTSIIHTLDPQSIIEVLEGHLVVKTPHRHYQYNDELYTLRIHHLFTQQFDSEQHHLIVTKILDKAWHWYMAYQKWEDDWIDEMENSG